MIAKRAKFHFAEALRIPQVTDGLTRSGRLLG